jgi:hypothetical protein
MSRLIDADALINEAGKLWSEMPDGEELSKELMKAINHAPTIGGWISVKDRLPKDGLISKLICDDNNNVRICDKVTTVTLSNGEKVFSSDSQLVDFIMEGMKVPPDKITHITHWMPLPEPPKEDATSGNH